MITIHQLFNKLSTRCSHKHFQQINSLFTKKIAWKPLEFQANQHNSTNISGYNNLRQTKTILPSLLPAVLTKENICLSVNGQNGLTLRAAKSSASCSFKALWTNRTAEHFRENTFFHRSTLLKKPYCLCNIVLNIKKLAEPQKLENFVNFRLNIQKYNIAAFRLYHF